MLSAVQSAYQAARDTCMKLERHRCVTNCSECGREYNESVLGGCPRCTPKMPSSSLAPGTQPEETKSGAAAAIAWIFGSIGSLSSLYLVGYGFADDSVPYTLLGVSSFCLTILIATATITSTRSK